MSAQLHEISRRLRQAVDVGESVIITGHREGIIRYKGPLDGKSGIFYGVELTKGTGKNDGVYKGRTRYFTCPKGKGIFVDKKNIISKKAEYLFKKRASLTAQPPVIYHCEFMKKSYGIYHRKKGIDPVKILLKHKWTEDAANATHWKQKWQLLKEFMKVICGDEYGTDDLPAQFIYNKHYEKILLILVEWLQKEKHLGSRKHILKLLPPFCKTYEIPNAYANILAKSVIQKQWKETKYGFRGLATKALLAVYYASACTLEQWMPYLRRCLQSKSDVRIQAWNFLSQIAILAANHKNTAKKQKALLDIEVLLCEGHIIELTKKTLNGNVRNNDKVMVACAEFIFGAKFLLPDLKSLNTAYIEVKENSKFMKDRGINEYCQLLDIGENGFDLYQPEVDTIERRKIWDESKIKCAHCERQTQDLKHVTTVYEEEKKQFTKHKQIVDELVLRNATFKQEMTRLQSEITVTDKQSRMIDEDVKEMEIEILTLRQMIQVLQSKPQPSMAMIEGIHWNHWDCDDVLQWILSLENGMFLKYKSCLNDVLLMENIGGNELEMVTKDDLIYLGINNNEHRVKLMQHIQTLTKAAHAKLDAPMAFQDVDLSLPLGPGRPFIGNGSEAQQEGIMIANENRN